MNNNASDKTPLKILIIRLSSIGDIVLTTPVIRILKNNYPNSKIDFVIKKQFEGLIKHHPSINHIFTFDKNDPNMSIGEIKKQIIQTKYDFVFDLHKNFRSLYLTRGIRTAKIIRYKKHGFRRFLLVKLKVNLFRNTTPVYKRYINTLRPLSVSYDDNGLDIFYGPNDDKFVLDKYKHFLSGNFDTIIGIAPGASFATKQWTSSGFEEVINNLSEKSKTAIILFGNSSDRELINSLNIKTTQNVLNAAGQLTLLQTTALMDKCDLFLTNDSGLMHIAAALKKKIVAIFGGTTEQLGFFPATTRPWKVVQNTELKCRPCSHIGRSQCPKKHFKCMKEIDSEQVLNALNELSKL